MLQPFPPRRLRIVLIVLVAAIWTIAALWIGRQATTAELQTRRELGTIARILAEHAEHAVQSVDRLMVMLNPRLVEVHADSAALRLLLQEAIQGLPHVRAALVLDPGGVAIGDSESAVPRPFHGADRDYFLAHQRPDSQGLFIGAPYRSRLTDQWGISLSRRLVDPTGAFLGVVVVAVDPQYFVDTFGDLAALDVDTVALIGRDGILRARYPANVDWLGRQPYADVHDIEANPFGNVQGWFRGHSAIDGADRHVAFEVMRSFPLIVTVGRAAARTAGVVRDEAIVVAGMATLLSLLVALAHWHLAGRLRATSAHAAALEEARQRAVESERVKSRFLANMSHELRTPLNAIIGFSQLLRNENGEPGREQRAEYARYIHEAGEHLLATVNDILDQASIEAGRVRIELEETDPREVIDSALRLVGRAAEQAGVRLGSRHAAGPMRIVADGLRLRQVIVNLLANAVKFTPAGGEVEIQCDRSDGGGTVIRVVDTGIGMSAQEIATALQPFGRVDNPQTRAREGTGLGLPIAKALAELQGAALSVLSRPGIGTTVSVAFPAAATHVGPPPRLDPAASAPLGSPLRGEVA